MNSGEDVYVAAAGPQAMPSAGVCHPPADQHLCASLCAGIHKAQALLGVRRRSYRVRRGASGGEARLTTDPPTVGVTVRSCRARDLAQRLKGLPGPCLVIVRFSIPGTENKIKPPPQQKESNQGLQRGRGKVQGQGTDPLKVL